MKPILNIQSNIRRKKWRRRLKSKLKAKIRRKLKPIIKSLFEVNGQSFETKYEAPKIFSFASNKIGVLSLIAQLEKNLYKERSVFVDMSHIELLDIDALVFLLGIMAEYKTRSISFNGNFPKILECKELLLASGFLKALFPVGSSYNFGSSNGIITHGANIIDQQLTFDVVSNALVCVFGKKVRSQGIQRLLIEAMKNTFSHAAAGEQNGKRRHWWLSYNQDIDNKKASFTFLDYGVGIFESLRVKENTDPGYGWIESHLKLGVSNRSILQKIMNGELQHITRTKKKQQGNGLPGIKSALDLNFISKLTILSNNVYADIGENSYIELKVPFSGTMLSFEVIDMCKSFEYEEEI